MLRVFSAVLFAVMSGPALSQVVDLETVKGSWVQSAITWNQSQQDFGIQKGDNPFEYKRKVEEAKNRFLEKYPGGIDLSSTVFFHKNIPWEIDFSRYNDRTKQAIICMSRNVFFYSREVSIIMKHIPTVADRCKSDVASPDNLGWGTSFIVAFETDEQAEKYFNLAQEGPRRAAVRCGSIKVSQVSQDITCGIEQVTLYVGDEAVGRIWWGKHPRMNSRAYETRWFSF